MPDIANRSKLEKELARKLGKVFGALSGHLLELLEEYDYDIESIPLSTWKQLTKQQQAVLLPFLESVSLASAEQLMTSIPIGVDWALVNQRAADWARGYSTLLAGQIDQTSRGAIASSIRNSIAAYFEEGLTMDQLTGRMRADPDLAQLFTKDVKDSLGRIYGPQRAEMISVTEVTMASMQGEVAIADELASQGIQMTAIWQTSNDELVCPDCAPRHNKPKGDGWYDEEPAHPRCRCWVNHELPKV